MPVTNGELLQNANQPWYSQPLAIIKLLIPEWPFDFSRCYEISKGRKVVTKENYLIDNYLNEVEITPAFKKMVVGPIDALPQFEMSCNGQPNAYFSDLPKNFEKKALVTPNKKLK
jgi:hypothetical protein